MMRGSRNLLLAGFLSFGVTLLVGWPARSLQSLLPAGVACSALTGTVWRGHCAQLTVQGLRFGSVDWQLHPSRLLLGSLSATLRLDQPGLMLAAKIAIGLTGKVEARDLDLRLALGALPLAAVPADLRGRVVAHFDAVDWRDGGVIALAGRVEASELTRGDREPLRIGSYEIVFDAAPSGWKRQAQLDVAGSRPAARSCSTATAAQRSPTTAPACGVARSRAMGRSAWRCTKSRAGRSPTGNTSSSQDSTNQVARR